MSKQNKVKVYGKLYDRYDARTVTITVSKELIDQAFTLSKSKDDDAKEDFVDLIVDSHHAVFVLLQTIVFKSERGVVKASKAWNNVGKFCLCGEEFVLGVGEDLTAAKLEYVAADK